MSAVLKERNYFWDTPYDKLYAAWDDYDKQGTYLPGIRALCVLDRYYLLVKVLKRYDVLKPWLYERCREVERDPDGYLDLWARGHYKSTIITYAGSIQELLKNPNETIGIFSHTKPIAKAFLSQIKRELESNEVLKKAFPDVLWERPDHEAPSWSLDGGLIVKRSSNPKEASLEAHGLVDGQPTSRHFGLMIYDDVVTLESVSTPEQVSKTTAAWELSDNLGKPGGRRRYIGTRYSYGDSYEAIIKRGSARPRVYPATADGTMVGRPVLLSQYEWDRTKRDQGESTVAAQMLQNPLAGKQRMFDINDLGIYECRPEVLNVYVLCDPARSKKKDSANTAIAVIGIDYASNKYLLDGMNHKMDLQERWEAIRNLYQKWKVEPGIFSVNVGYEKFGAQADFDYFQERMKTEREAFEIVELEWPSEGEGSKTDRVQRLVPDMRNHRIYLPYPTDPERLTALQKRMSDDGYSYRVAGKIRRKDENGRIYDLCEHLRQQLHYFPFGGLKDLVDALSRIYDMEPSPPTQRDEGPLEPDIC